MTGFGMSNMDYTPVKFMIKCFEANYPESLGSVLVYKAPWIFQGIWKVIKGWLDPVVAGKVHFADDEAKLAEFVDTSRILKELGGPEDYVYKYIEPVEGENALMHSAEGKARRQQLEAERKSIVNAYEKVTLDWAKGASTGPQQDPADARAKSVTALRDNYWLLDPHVRARCVYDRIGLLGAGGKLDSYPAARPAPVETHSDDVE